MTDRSQSLWLRLPEGTTSRGGANPMPLPTSGRVVFGASPDADIRLSGEGLAAEHALIAPLKDGGFGLRGLVDDQLPRRGGQSARAVRLALGDAFEIGPHRFQVEAAPSKRRAQELVIPGFEVQRQIGRGAQARVYLANQESLDREVALKVLRADLGRDTAFVQRFQAEARAAASLHHANVVTVFDVLEHEGTHLLAMEYMERGSLEDRLGKEGALPWRAVLGILRDAASGLEFAESRGLVHRDIKPANLMQNAAGVTKIADLGLATASETDDERIVGTPHFMAPEQARGGAVDARADLYALGSSAYRLLSAKTPFEGDSGREILRNKLAGPPPALAELAPECPAGLIDLIEQLMAKDPDDRPASAARVRARIEELIRAQDPNARAASAGTSGARRWIPVGIAVLSLAGAGYGAWLAFGDSPRADPSSRDESRVAGGSGLDEDGDPGEPAQTDASTAENRNLPWDPILGEDPENSGTIAEEDQALRALEQEAAIELAAAQASVDPEVRERELNAIVQQYAGTDAARQAAEALAAQAGTTDAQATTDTGLDPELDAQRALVAYLGEARAAASAAGEWLPPHPAIAALEDYTAPPETVDEQAFAQARNELADIARQDLAESARQKIVLARRHLTDGKLDLVREQLTALFEWCVTPPLDEKGEPRFEAPSVSDTDRTTWPTALRELPEITHRVQDALSGLEELEVLYARSLKQADRKLLATALGPDSGFDERAADSDPAEATARINLARGKAATEPVQQTLSVLARALEDAAAARLALESSFAAGRWKRRSIRLPGDRRGGAEVVAVDSRGLVTEKEIFPLAEYGSDPEAVHLLFDTRIEGEWTSTERRQAASWIFLSALLRSHEDLVQRLNGSRGKLSPEQHAEAFQLVIAWTQTPGGVAAAPGSAELQALAARGAIASSRLADGLDAARGGDSVRGAFQLGQTLEDHYDHPLVAMLADGTPLEDPVDWNALCKEWLE